MTSLAIVLLNSADAFADKAIDWMFGIAVVVVIGIGLIRWIKESILD